MSDFLLNINKQKCKSCMWGETPIQLREGRVEEITEMITSGTAMQICHTNNRTCRGGAEVLAKHLHEKGQLPEPSVSMLERFAQFFLGKRKS